MANISSQREKTQAVVIPSPAEFLCGIATNLGVFVNCSHLKIKEYVILTIICISSLPFPEPFSVFPL